VTPELITGEVREADQVSAEALTDALAYFAELPNWSTVTLADVAAMATDDHRLNCQCGARAS
jgi:hypothetical protein